MQLQTQVEHITLADVEARECAFITERPARMDQAYLLRGVTFLVLDLSLDVADGFSVEGLDVEELFVSVLHQDNNFAAFAVIRILVHEVGHELSIVLMPKFVQAN